MSRRHVVGRTINQKEPRIMAAHGKMTYKEFIKQNKLAQDRHAPYYAQWVKWFAQYCRNDRRRLTWSSVTTYVQGKIYTKKREKPLF